MKLYSVSLPDCCTLNNLVWINTAQQLAVRVLHVDHRLAVLRRSPFSAAGQVLRSVHGRRAVQLHPAGWLLLDHADRDDHALHRHLPSRSAAASTV